MSFLSTPSVSGRGEALMRSLSRAFPVPRMLLPSAAGIDISDASIKWLVLNREASGYRVSHFGELPLEGGVVVSGIIRDVEGLAAALREVRGHLGPVVAAHAALPEEAAYVFSMDIPAHTSREQTLRMIEFEFEGRVPIPPAAAVYDFNRVARTGGIDEIGVVVFPREIAEDYARAFERAGITLLSLEVEAASIARAVACDGDGDPITLIVDFGRARTGFAVIKHGVPIFTSTVEVGGENITHALIEKLSINEEEAERYKNEQGIAPKEKAEGLEAVMGATSALADEIARHYHYWDTRRNDAGERMTPVGRVVIVGGSANLNGLADYVASRVQAPTEIGTVWTRITNFETYIPPIDRRQSLQFATAIGLALRGI